MWLIKKEEGRARLSRKPSIPVIDELAIIFYLWRVQHSRNVQQHVHPWRKFLHLKLGRKEAWEVVDGLLARQIDGEHGEAT
jgi:hypothetical protein